MTITVEQIDSWRRADSEHECLEFKEAKQQFDQHKLLEYCVAIANEGGGVLLLGIANNPPRAVVGTQAFNSLSGIAKRIFQHIGFRVDVEEVDHPEGRVVVFQIPSRPMGSAHHLDGQYLMRLGESLVPMSPERLRAIFDEGRPDWLTESAVTGVDDAGIVDLLDTQSLFDLLRLPYPATRPAVIERMIRERLITKTGSQYAISNLGAILFAKQIDRFAELSRRAPRVIVYDGKGKIKTKRDQFGTKGYAIGFDGLLQFVLSQMPASEIVDHGLRRESTMFPAIMIRETVANALIHQDFAATGSSVVVEIYDDRIEISNPGKPSVEVNRFIDEYRSRNERLADLMRRIGVCEEKGSGIDKVVDLAEAAQLPAPEFRVDNVRTTCILYGPRPFVDMTKEDRIRACYQHACLRYVMNSTMTNQSLRKRFGLPKERAETASRVLRDTTEAGLIRLEDTEGASRRFAKYLPFWA